MLPETPDFDQIARQMFTFPQDDGTGTIGVIINKAFWEARRVAVATHLRLIWNARGAADLTALDEVAHTNGDAVADAIRNLDR